MVICRGPFAREIQMIAKIEKSIIGPDVKVLWKGNPKDKKMKILTKKIINMEKCEY